MISAADPYRNTAAVSAAAAGFSRLFLFSLSRNFAIWLIFLLYSGIAQTYPSVTNLFVKRKRAGTILVQILRIFRTRIFLRKQPLTFDKLFFLLILKASPI